MATADDIDETSDLKPSFHIVIIGAGLIGLATAILLRKAGYKVTVLEQDTELRPIGAGIQLPANSTRVLKELGILEKAVVKAIQPHAIILYSYETGSVLNTTSLDPYVQATYGVPHLVIHRADLRELLCDEAVARGADIRLGSKVELFEETNSGNVVIHVGKGGKLDANLVIGADGARSMCREALTQRPDRPKFMGKIAYRIVVHEEAMARNPRLGEFISPPNVHTWLGPGSFVVGYPLKGVFNIVATRPAPANEEIFFGARPVDVEVLKYLFRDWDIRMRDLLEIATEFQKWMVFEGEELESWVSPGEKFVLTGDAAHAPLPYLTQGAAMGFESASVLSNLLARADRATQVPDMLHLYAAIRQPRTSHVIRASRKMGDTYEMPNGPLQVERDRQYGEDVPSVGYPNMLRDPFFQLWLWGFDARKDAEDAWGRYVGNGVVES